MICDFCKEKFNREEAREEFEDEMPGFLYDNFKDDLCAKCAIEVIEGLVDNIYFEECERCHKKYDLIDDNCRFENLHTNEYGNYASIHDLTDEFLCFECALDEYNS